MSNSSDCRWSAVGVAGPYWHECHKSVISTCGPYWDMVSCSGGSVFSCPHLIVAHYKSPICMKELFKSFLNPKVAGTVFSLASKRICTHNSKSALAGSLTPRPVGSSISILPRVFEVFWCVIGAFCRNTSNDTLMFGLHTWSARFTVWAAL